MDPTAIGAGLGLLSGLMSPNQSGEYNNYANSMHQYANQYNPWVHSGLSANHALGHEMAYNAANPTGEMNQIASSWHSSPYQSNLMHGVAGMMNSNAGLTGMLGSQSQNSALQGALTNMINGFQHQYVTDGMNQYNNALDGQRSLSGQGLGALGAQTQLNQEGALGSLQGAHANDQWNNNLMGNMFGGGMAGYKGLL